MSYTTNDKSVYFITNNGTFTVQDTSDNADGKILLTAQPDTGYSVETVTVYNLGGTLNLDSGIIENATAGGLAYAVNNSSNAWGTPVVSTFNMTGGILRGANTDNTLRVYQNSSMTQTSTNIVNISGGTIENGIFVDTTIYQPTSAYTGSNITVDINISGGTINGLVDLKLRHGFNTSLDITGGDFTNAQIWVRKKANEWNANVAEPTEPIVSISGGKFSFAAGKAFGLAYDCAASEWTRYSKPYVVTGGVFNVDLNNYAGIAFEEGSMGVDNTNAQTMVAYPYTVEHFVASITSGDPATTIYYHTLAEAVAAAENGDEIVMIANSTENVLYDVTSPNLKNKTIAISGEYALTSPSGNFGFYFGNYDGGNRPATDVLTVSDITMTKSGGNYTTLFDGVTADLTGVTVNGDGNTALSYANGAVGTLTNVTVTNTGNHSQTWRNTALALQGIGAGPSVVTVKSGTYTSANGYAVYMFSSGGIVNIEGGTFSGALMAQIDNKTYPGNYATINISGGTFTNCTLTESGGENAQIYISGGYFSVDPTAYLVAGYTVQVLTSNATGADLAAYEAGAIYKVVPSDDVIVIFNAHGGKFADASITKNVNVVNDVVPEENMPANPTRLGYTFAGWYASENEGETLSDTAFDFTAPITEEVTVYAKWEGDANYFFNSGMRAYTTSSLNESINLNLYIEHLPEGTEMTDYSVRVTFNGSTTTFAYSAADATKVAGTYRHMLADVYAYQMTFPITFTLLYNNEVEIFTTSDYSVKDYMLYRSNAGDATDKEKTLMKAALDYGAVAQQYFASRYETDAEHLANATTNPYNVIEVARPTQTSEFYNSIASLTAFKSSMVYDSVNYIRIRIGDSQDLEGIEFSLEGDGFAMTEPVWEETNGLWMIQVSGLTSPKLGDEFTLTMTKGGQSTIFTYSAYAYANYMWDDAVDGRLSQALVAYGDAAKAFFGN